MYKTLCIPAEHWHWCVPRSIPMHIPKRIYIYIYVIIKTMCPPGCHHNGFVGAYALGQMMCEFKHLLWCTSPHILHVERFSMFTVPHESYFFEFSTCRTSIYFFTIQWGQILKCKKRKNIGATNEKFKKITLVQHCKHGKSAQRAKFAG